MRSTVTGPYRSGIGHACKYNKLGMVRDEYEIGNSINRVITHKCGPATRSDIYKINSVTTINWVESATTINYDEVVSNKVGDDDV